MGLLVGPNYQQRINHLDQPLKKLKREKAHKLNIMKIRVIQVQKNFEFQKNVTVEKLGYIKNPVEHKASVLALKNRERERERERGISYGGVRETKRKPPLINLMFNSNSNSWVSVFFWYRFLVIAIQFA